ncbi:transcriptional coactivator p15/PC4 family protein [Omnitrophica bacterium]|nr:transcriptional coactivator p15/PC4 family protein [Candidatus Omnitrophota bacterium]
MENETLVENQNNEIGMFKDVMRSENDVYRIARREYKGRHFVDVRIYYRSKQASDDLLPTRKGICLEETLRQDLIEGLIRARQSSLPEKTEGEGIQSISICDIPVSDNEVCRISKGQGKKNAFVDIRRFFSKNGGYVPYKHKGVCIAEAALDDVITGLIDLESSIAS